MEGLNLPVTMQENPKITMEAAWMIARLWEVTILSNLYIALGLSDCIGNESMSIRFSGSLGSVAWKYRSLIGRWKSDHSAW